MSIKLLTSTLRDIQGLEHPEFNDHPQMSLMMLPTDGAAFASHTGRADRWIRMTGASLLPSAVIF